MSLPENIHLPAQTERRLAALEARVAALERAAGRLPATPFSPPGPGQAPRADPAGAPPQSISIPGGAGRVFLILGGAFFLRALTDGGTLHQSVGVALGLAYALAWALQAWRTARTGEAGSFALASILIAYPLLVEATTSFRVLSPLASASVLGALTLLHLAVAWRRTLAWLSWATLWVGIGTGFFLLTATHAIALFTGYFLLLGIGIHRSTAGRSWSGLRWPSALAVDLVVLVLGLLAAWPGGVPEGYSALRPSQAFLLALALPGLYIGTFSWQLLNGQRDLHAFEWTQSALALAIGMAGAWRIAPAVGAGKMVLAILTLGSGVSCYALAIHIGPRRKEAPEKFRFVSSLATCTSLVGVATLTNHAVLGIASAFLGLISLALGLQFRRTVLVLQGVLCLGLAALASGLISFSLQGFLASVETVTARAIHGPAWVVALALGASGFLVEIRRPPECFPTRLRFALLLLEALGVLGAGGLSVTLLLHLGGAAWAQPWVLAFLRTAVLSSFAVILALQSRGCPQGELRLLTYPVLALAVLKVLVEDLPLGRPLMLFLAFMCLGGALILVPRLRKPKAS